MKRRLRKFLLLLIVLLALTGAGLTTTNNRTVPQPTSDELEDSLERSILWLINNRDHVLTQNNPILFWMLKESGRHTNDERLLHLAEDYVQNLPVFSPWQYFFNPNSLAAVKPEYIATLPDYNILFLYGLTCDDDLANLETVQAQLEIGFCRENHLISPACYTHQLMGLRFMQRRSCGDQEFTSELIAKIQNKIATQLFWDPRAVDVTIQRVLMLTDSGAASRVKSVWLRNVLKAQLPDGGWGGFQPLIPLGKSRFLGLTAKGIGIEKPRSNLHATAQGILLMSLLTTAPH